MKAELGWESLQERRAKARMLMLHKIKHNLVAIPNQLFVLKPNTTIVTRGAQTKHFIPNARIIALERSFMHAAPSMWDRLPTCMTMEPDHETFRGDLAPVVLIA